MKKILMMSLFVSANAFAADFTYCKQAFQGVYSLDKDKKKDFPFTIDDSGKFVPHKDVKSYKYDEKKHQAVMEIGEGMTVLKYVIDFDEKGLLKRVATIGDYKAPNVKIGMGSKNKGGIYGMGMMGMGMGMGAKDFHSEFVTDIKMQNGKCFPYRSHSEVVSGAIVEKHMLTEVQLCRDIEDFFKANPEAKSCFDKNLNEKMAKIFNNHKERNDDLYHDDEDVNTTIGNFGYPGFGMGTGIGMGMGMGMGMGGMGMMMSMDSLVENTNSDDFTGAGPIVSAGMLRMYCTSSGTKAMVEDDELFKKEADLKTDQTSTSQAVTK